MPSTQNALKNIKSVIEKPRGAMKLHGKWEAFLVIGTGGDYVVQ
jgi:hypothetical protein